jgi:hyperosmotically inducible protein
MTTRQTMTMSAVSMLLASMALAGCGRPDDTQTAQTNESTAAAQAERAAEKVSQGAEKTAEATREAARDLKSATQSAADQATDKVADAVITTSVNAELAKDPELSSLSIDVDTDNGRVALKGSAPDEQSKQRATQLASSVQGVVSVDNQLVVSGKS